MFNFSGCQKGHLTWYHKWPMNYGDTLSQYQPCMQCKSWPHRHASVRFSFRTHQALDSSYFDEKKMFQHMRHLLGTRSTCYNLYESRRWPTKRKCFIVPHWFGHLSWVPAYMNDKYWGTTVPVNTSWWKK